MMKVNPCQILSLAPQGEFPCLSLYADSERELALLLAKAEEIGLKKYDAKTLDTLFKPVHCFLKRHQKFARNSPTALFSSKNFSGYSRLPFAAMPLAVVADSFHVKPLLKWMQREHPFSLLQLNEREAVLFQGSLGHLEETERLPYRELRAMDGIFNALDRAVYRSIQSSKVPLILAGEYELMETYKAISGYASIVDEVILDPSATEDQQKLHLSAIRVLEPFLEKRENALVRSYWNAERRGRTSSIFQDIVHLALRNQVRHLFINERLNVWGKINKRTAKFTYNSQQIEPEDDILDDLAEIVIRNHGVVTVLPASKMPGGKAACAILSKDTGWKWRPASIPLNTEKSWLSQSAS